MMYKIRNTIVDINADTFLQSGDARTRGQREAIPGAYQRPDTVELLLPRYSARMECSSCQHRICAYHGCLQVTQGWWGNLTLSSSDMTTVSSSLRLLCTTTTPSFVELHTFSQEPSSLYGRRRRRRRRSTNFRKQRINSVSMHQLASLISKVSANFRLPKNRFKYR